MDIPINIFEEILQKAPALLEQDIDEWIVPRLMVHYSAKINSLSILAYGHNKDGFRGVLPLLAFRERSKQEIHNSIFTYLFKSEHWRTGRDINSYILTSLNRLAQRIHWDSEGTQKMNVPVCPACRLSGRREFLHFESKMLRCTHCTNEVSRIDIEKRENDTLFLDMQLILRNCFALHSRKGFRCPDCERFIPASSVKLSGISCPYSNCYYFSRDVNLELMAHPMGLKDRPLLSLNASKESKEGDARGRSLEDKLKSTDANADVQIEVVQTFQKEFNVVKDIMNLQQIRLNKEASTSFQKTLMYEAFQSMLDNNPEDMVSYLAHEKTAGDYPIQARIFQEYCKLVEQSLPCVIVKNNEEYDICSLLDPHLDLFTGISEFKSSIKADHSIPNSTIETYKDKRCFIGKVIDIKLESTNESIKHLIKEYSFSKIKMNTAAPTSVAVCVEHFRIPAHYEIGSLVHLQRIRKRIVDSVYFKLHGKKRKAR